MRYAVPLADLRRAGLVLNAEEAVAVALQLIHKPVDSCRPPFGPLAAGRVQVTDDGLAECAGCDATPTVAELAIVLDDLLRATPHVPGGLRYAVARALHEVDAPPFDSLDDFADALMRYAPKRPDDTVRRLVARSDRRRPASRAELRLQLREADRRLYESQVRLIDPPREEPRPHGWMIGALVAGALTMIAAASVVGDRPPDMPSAPPPPIQEPSFETTNEVAVHPVFVAPVSHSTVLHPNRQKPVSPKTQVHAQPSRTLRLRWFHKTIAIKDDLTRP